MKRDSSTIVNQGWKLEDQWYLDREDNAPAGPELQIFTEEDWEADEPGRREYYCSICKSRLDFLADTETIWRCNECMRYFHSGRTN